MSEFTLRDKQGVKVGNFHRSGPGTTHFVVVRKDDRAPSYYQHYTVEVDGKHATDIYRSGNGRNLTWRVDNSGSYGGTLAKAVERGVAAYLYSLDAAEEENQHIDWITGSLPYTFEGDNAEGHALDFAFSNPTEAGRVPVVAQYHSRWYVGFHQPDVAESVVAQLTEKINWFRGARIYGRIDPRVVQEALREQGVTGVHFDRTYTETVVYLNGGTDGTLLISKDGDVSLIHHDASGGVSVDEDIAYGKDAEHAVKAAARWWKSWDLQQRANAFLEYLEADVPDRVMHYAVEDAKKALRTLAHQAFTVDFTYDKIVGV